MISAGFAARKNFPVKECCAVALPAREPRSLPLGTILLLALASAAWAQTDETMVNFIPPSTWSGAATAGPNQNRAQVSAYAYPDFCATVDGGMTTDNTTCLMNALNATGRYFSTLEVPSLPPCGTCTTQSQTNYSCTSLGLTWPNPTARIHIWKGASVSCAFPPADATHVIQDDNQVPVIPWSSATFPSTNVGAVYTCTSCATPHNDMSAAGTYTGTIAGSYCIEIQSTTTLFEWGFSGQQ
jgi:hypothetical protein